MLILYFFFLQHEQITDFLVLVIAKSILWGERIKWGDMCDG